MGGARGKAILLISDAGCVAAHRIAADDWTIGIAFPVNASYVRGQVVDGVGNILAVSNPVWREAP